MKRLTLTEPMVAMIARCFLVGGMALALLPHTAWAQSGVGTIAGTVVDFSGAVVPGATLTLTSRETGVVRKGVSSATGDLYFGAIPRGQYTLDVESPGFKKWSGTLELEVGQAAKVHPVLDVGQLEDVVEVTSAAAPISLESSEVADVKDYRRIRQLPLNGRAISSLFDLTPGVEGGGNARVAGGKVGSLEITLDGISLVDRFGGGIARIQPGLDTIQEFRIETVGSDARFSRPATVTLVSRSGTNQFRGSAFETHRNNSGGCWPAGAKRHREPRRRPWSATSSACQPAGRCFWERCTTGATRHSGSRLSRDWSSAATGSPRTECLRRRCGAVI